MIQPLIQSLSTRLIDQFLDHNQFFGGGTVECHENIRFGRIWPLPATAHLPITRVLNRPAGLIGEGLSVRNIDGFIRGRVSLSSRADAGQGSANEAKDGQRPAPHEIAIPLQRCAA